MRFPFGFTIASCELQGLGLKVHEEENGPAAVDSNPDLALVLEEARKAPQTSASPTHSSGDVRMGGKQSTAGRPRGAFPGVSTDDSAVPPSAHFGHYRPGGTMGLRSRSVSSVAGMGIDHSAAVPFGFYAPRGTDSDRAGGGSGTESAHNGNGFQEPGGGHHTDGMLYLGSRASLADTLPLHIAPRWFSAHSGK